MGQLTRSLMYPLMYPLMRGLLFTDSNLPDNYVTADGDPVLADGDYVTASE